MHALVLFWFTLLHYDIYLGLGDQNITEASGHEIEVSRPVLNMRPFSASHKTVILRMAFIKLSLRSLITGPIYTSTDLYILRGQF